MNKKLAKKLQELQRKGFESVTIEQVLQWIRDFGPIKEQRTPLRKDK
jgi:hypothetical protein